VSSLKTVEDEKEMRILSFVTFKGSLGKIVAAVNVASDPAKHHDSRTRFSPYRLEILRSLAPAKAHTTICTCVPEARDRLQSTTG